MVTAKALMQRAAPWLAVAVSAAVVPAAAPATPPEEVARGVLAASGVRGGLVVHVGCAGGRLTAALRAGDAFLVQGLDTDAEAVAAAREHIRRRGRYGAVSAEPFDGRRLPYADGIVNLLVADDLGRVPMDEVMRVLAPGGAVCVGNDGEWTTTRKPWPDRIDEWTHFLHDASNNAVAADTRVGPPRRLRWVCGPLWSRSHEFNSSLCAMVSGGGRVFYIFDEGLTGVTPRSLPERWTLVARDAFNGVLLWKRRVPKWGSDRWKSRALRSIPPAVPRRLVVDGDRLFVTLGYDAPVSVLDAATGRTLATWKETEGAEELRLLEGVLLVRNSQSDCVAVDAKTGRRLWEAEGRLRPLSLAARDGRVFYQDAASLVCRRLADGKEQWRVPCERAVGLLVACGDRVLVQDPGGLRAVSAATGEDLWAAGGRAGRRELFAAAGCAWQWEGHGVVGRDLGTGERVERLGAEDVFTPGHHLRCYQSKATVEYLITPNRGVEFLSLTGGENTQCDWTRGPCRYGIMPCNGLLYVPPHPCFCYPGVKLTGFNALAPAADGPDPQPSGDRLQRGPAYANLPSPAGGRGKDWPTYRHDARRTGGTPCEVPARVARCWETRLGGELTPPVVAGGRIYVASKKEQTLHVLRAEDGRPLWRFTAGGPIDSPPTVVGGRVLFGGADGWVYCLRAEDGRLAWRFRAAPGDRRIVAFGRLESPWRVHGSVLVDGGVAYCTAGRSSYLDGGIRLFGLDPATGEVLHRTRLDTWARTREDAEGKPFIPAYHMEGTHSDVLVGQGGAIYLGQVKLDRELAVEPVPYVLPGDGEKTVAMDLAGEPYVAADQDPKADYERHQRDWLERTQAGLLADLHRAFGGHNLGDRRVGLHVFATGGLLDDAWFNRTYWMYSATWPGYYIAHRASKTGQLLVVGPERTYAVQSYPSRNLQSPLFTPGEKGYLLFADDNDNEPVLDHRTRGTTKGWGFTRKRPPVWHRWVPLRVRAMVLAGGHLFIAGPPDVVDPDDPMAAFEGRQGALLWTHSASDGGKLAEIELPAPPVFDGLAAAGGRLVMCTTDGRVVSFGER